MVHIPEFTEHNECFACGKLRKDGLGLVFESTGSGIRCRIILDARFQSYEGTIHGGILATVADAAMVNVVQREISGQPVTGSLQVRYRASVRVGDEIEIRASVLRAKRHIVWASCRITARDRLCVEATAAFRIGPGLTCHD